MTINAHFTEFFGRPVREFKPGESFDLRTFVPRLSVDYDGVKWARRLEEFLQLPHAGETTHLVAGTYEGFEGDMNAAMAIGPLIEHRAALPKLEALFLGDMTFEECEISWIEPQDAEPILKAFPKLRVFGLRGRVSNFGVQSLPDLEGLILQNTGLTKANLAEILAFEAPALQEMELWTGSEDYGAETSVEDLAPLFSGEIFPRLTRLRLKDSEYADEIAKAVTQSRLFGRLEVLDLSMGTLGDEGAAALLEALPRSGLKLLDLSHHYMSDAMMEKFAVFGPRVVMADQQKEEDRGRYVAVAE
ncbi:hypothetical protein [Neomegalonema sp.]|uniref:hypothetical protein n=1 Tax=Neomegalonema sp. TaxID=2039713 RepID=UPI00260C5FEA|nr:hypothetical protein [Neomegalonema sp.]MDD2868485.1 hypothetical protein [Neomegalonema sp.]